MTNGWSKRGLGQMVGSGRTSEVYRFGPVDVIKLLRHSVPPAWAATEFEISNLVAGLGVQVPEPKGLVEVDGRAGIVFSRVVGPSLWEAAVADSITGSQLGRELASVHQEILRHAASSAMPTFASRIKEKLEEVLVLETEDRVAVNAMVEELPCGGSLLHGDLHPGNVLVSSDGPVVIDWFDGCRGDMHADVARSSILVRPTAGRSPSHLPGARPDLLADLQRSYRAAMAEVLGPFDPTPASRWEAVVAASRMAEAADDEASLYAIWSARP